VAHVYSSAARAENATGPGADSFRCSSCYHLFGVDLIADASGRFHVIEVNVSPDLTLSTEGLGAYTPGGSAAYDHTKRAAAYSLVRLVYSRQAVAAELTSFLERHADEISRLDRLIIAHPAAAPAANKSGEAAASQSAVVEVPSGSGALGVGGQPPMLQRDVAEYLLDMLREMHATGCFAPVYPSLRHHQTYLKQIKLMASRHACTRTRAAPPQWGTSPQPPGMAGRAPAAHSSSPTSGPTTPAVTCTYDGEKRLQMHTLLGIVLRDLEDGGRLGFRALCEGMLHEVPSRGSGAVVDWARRSHIFKQVWDLAA